MENNYLVDEIRNVIKSTVHPCYENTSKTELYCRCPNCGDSKKNKSSAHFYIRLAPPFSFYCQKCGYSGVLNQEVLQKLQLFDNNLLLNITEANKTISNNQNFTYKKKDVIFDYKDDENDQVAIISKNYFNERFGVDLSISELNDKFKCVCNPAEFLKQHNIDVSKSRFDFTKAIGFVSNDNKYIICRDVSGKQSLRYSNTALSNDEDKSKIYNIKTPINILEDKITLVITEGIFDCIGVYFKYYQVAENTIIAAACGKSYSQVIEKFIKAGFLNLDIKIYSDRDVDISFYNEMKKKLYYIKNQTIDVYYNKLGKDCGFSKDNIDVERMVV